MNPLVTKIADWLSRTFLACFLEILLEVFVHNWNRCVEVFSLNLEPFDIEYLFGVGNCFDAFTIYDVKDITKEVMTDNLIVLEDVNINAPVITQYITISEKSTSEDEFKLGKDSGDVSVDKKNNDWKNCELVENEKHEQCVAQYVAGVINENIYLAGDIPHDFHNNSICDKNRIYDKELLPVSQGSTDSEYISLENEFNLDKDAVYNEITEDKRNDNSKKYESTENDQQTQYLSIAMSIFDDNIYLNSNSAHNFHDESDSDKDNLHLEDEKFASLLDDSVKSGNGSQGNLSTNLIPISIFNDSIHLASNTTQNFQEDSVRDKDNLHLEDEKFSSLLDDSVKSGNGSQGNLSINLIPISIFNDSIHLTSNTTHNFQEDSVRDKDNLHLEDEKFSSLLDDSVKSGNGSQDNLSTNLIPISIFNDSIHLASNTTQNFQEDSDRDKDNLQLEDEEFFHLLDESMKSEYDFRENISANMIPISIFNDNIDSRASNTTQNFRENSSRDKDKRHLEDEEIFHHLDGSAKSNNGSQDHLCTNSIPTSIFNDNIDLRARNTTHNFSEDSNRDKNNLYFEGEAFSQLIDQSGTPENSSQDNICTNLIPISTLTYGYDNIRKTTYNFRHDSDHDIDNLQFEDDFCFLYDESGKLEKGSQDNLCKHSIKSKYLNYKGSTTKKVSDKILTVSSVHTAKNKPLKDIEERPSTETDVSAHDTSNKAESQPTFHDKEISIRKIPPEDVQKTFLPVVLPDEPSELKKEIKFPGNPNSNSLEFNISNESVEKGIDKSRVYFSDEIQTFIYEPISDIVDKLPSEDESKKGNALFIKDEKYAKLKFGRRHRSHDCIKQDSHIADTENIVSVGKERSKYWSKFNLSCHIFRKNKSEESLCDKKEKSGKHLCFKRMKMHHKSIKDKLLPNFLKK